MIGGMIFAPNGKFTRSAVDAANFSRMHNRHHIFRFSIMLKIF